jgi:hypothetical protein
MGLLNYTTKKLPISFPRMAQDPKFLLGEGS